MPDSVVDILAESRYSDCDVIYCDSYIVEAVSVGNEGRCALRRVAVMGLYIVRSDVPSVIRKHHVDACRFRITDPVTASVINMPAQ